MLVVSVYAQVTRGDGQDQLGLFAMSVITIL